MPSPSCVHDEWGSNNITVKIIYTPAIFLDPQTRREFRSSFGLNTPVKSQALKKFIKFKNVFKNFDKNYKA